MKSFSRLFYVAIGILLFQFCKPVEEVTTDSSVFLRFEVDTLSFDTVFTGQLSITKKFKVYNTSDNAINISSIRLGGMSNSYYSLIINGVRSNQTANIFLRGRDSLFILASVNLNSNSEFLPFLVTDSIMFLTNSNEQKVFLESYGRNASYFNGDTIKVNTLWDSTTAKFIKKTIVVANSARLTIEKGTQVYFVKGAGLQINGSIEVKGTAEKRVVFQGPRLDKDYGNLPGLWKGITISKGSLDNSIDFAVIKNAEIGLMVGDSDQTISTELKITNSVIKNMSQHGLKASSANLVAWNCLVYNCAYNGFSFSETGDYRCYNNTLAFVYSDFNRFGSAISIKDGSRKFELINNIIWGKGFSNEEFDAKTSVSDVFYKNLTKSSNTELANDTTNYWNIDPLFQNENDDKAENLNYRLDSLSPMREKGKQLLLFNSDLDGKKRNEKWDVGAYQFK